MGRLFDKLYLVLILLKLVLWAGVAGLSGLFSLLLRRPKTPFISVGENYNSFDPYISIDGKVENSLALRYL